MQIRMKKGVKLTELSNVIKEKLSDICEACQELEGKKYIVTITSGNDGKHMKGSKHYTNEAIDIRSKDMFYPVGTTLRIRKKLGRHYDVILERDHIHIEYDKKA
jgi:hypothetical protein